MSLTNHCTIWLLIINTYFVIHQQTSAIECGKSSQNQYATTTKHLSNKIIGGERAQLGVWPWQALLIGTLASTGEKYLCGGTVISEWWILTAAHCVYNIGSGAVYLGIIDITVIPNEVGYDIDIDSVYIHPLYVGVQTVSNYDIALIKLKRKILLNDSGLVQPICLPIDDRLLTTTTGYMTGWGHYTLGNSSSVSSDPSRDLLQTEAPFIDSITCQKRWGPLHQVIGADQLCAGAFGHGVYSGDSGGPLQVRANDGRWYQTGITSFAVASPELIIDQKTYPSVFARVSYFCDFIEEKTGGSVTCLSIQQGSSSSSSIRFKANGICALVLPIIFERLLSKLLF